MTRNDPNQLGAVTGGGSLSSDADRDRFECLYVAAGDDEIAGRLVVSPATVRTHVSRAMAKLYARDRAQLVVFFYQSGLVGQTRSRPT